MKMRVMVITLAISSIFALLALTACGDETTDKGEKKPTPPPVETPTPTPSPEPVPTPEILDPVIESPPPELPATPMTYEEAMAICEAWLDARPELSPYTLYDMAEPDSDYPVPPTFSVLGEHYYTFYVTYDVEDETDYFHVILVHEETGELLSSTLDINDDDFPTMIVEMLEDWYRGERAEPVPALLSVDEALGIYQTRMDDLPDDQDYFSEIRLERQPQGGVVLFGEQYYLFGAEENNMYWYNILVHMVTGDLLFMWIHDGMYGGYEIVLLDDLIDSW